jgi:hypothetical protein
MRLHEYLFALTLIALLGSFACDGMHWWCTATSLRLTAVIFTVMILMRYEK